jgi:hypothetical protein
VTITGSDFAGVTGVTFNGHAATITGTPTDTKLTVTVPDDDGATGLIAVTTAGATPTGTSTKQFTFLAKPENLTLDHDSAAVGETVKVSGDNLGTTTAVTFNGHPAKFTLAKDKASLTATVPDFDDVGGTITLTNAGGSADVPDAFTQAYLDPVITAAPTSGQVGSTITITGRHFRGTTHVTFDGHSASYLPVSDTKLQVTVPQGSDKGRIVVTGAGGTTPATSPKDFTPKWPKPTIKSFTPAGAAVSATVTVTGTGFYDVTGVKVGNVDVVSYTVDSPTQITITVPAGATTGKVIVVTKGGTATSSKALMVT